MLRRATTMLKGRSRSKGIIVVPKRKRKNFVERNVNFIEQH